MTSSGWSPTGIEVSEAFASYVAALRSTWRIDEQALAAARSDEVHGSYTA